MSPPPPTPTPALDGAALARVQQAERAAAARLPSDHPLDPERRRRVDATRPELFGQPGVVARNLAASAGPVAALAADVAAYAPARVVLVGAGDSLAAAQAARLAVEDMTGLACEPAQSLEFAYYTARACAPRALVVALSSSGETARTVEATGVARDAGALVVALTNSPGSTLARHAAHVLPVDASRVGWPTQSTTAPIAILLALAAELGRQRGAAGAGALAAALRAAPALMAQAIERLDGPLSRQADLERDQAMYLFSGAGPAWPAAVVGAAKVKEATPDHALAVQLEEFHHCNSIKAGEPLWLFVTDERQVPRARDTIEEAARLGGRVHVIATEDAGDTFDGAVDVLTLPAVDLAVAPLVALLPAQLIGYHLAMAKFAAAQAGER
ncbi:MAG TPA: SIS domain-containing protein [Trebonia sp.]|nr:SIS domain-containing protein [Trebonia sp.]